MNEYLYFCMDDDGHASIYMLLEEFLDFLKIERFCAFSIFEKHNNMFRKNARYDIDFRINLDYIGNIEEVKEYLEDDCGQYECLPQILDFLNNEIEELKLKEEEQLKQQKEQEKENAYKLFLELKEKYNFS